MATRPTPSSFSLTAVVCAVSAGVLLSGCSLFSAPTPTQVDQPSLAPPGAVGYVVCPSAVTPVELGTRTAEPNITLPVSGASGDSAIAASANGRWAYVVNSGLGTDGILRSVVIPINLVTQQTQAPIEIPGQGGTHAIVVLAGGRTVLAGSGNTVVPIDVTSRRVGAPLALGAGNTVYGLALDPTKAKVYALVTGGVIPVSVAHGQVVGVAGKAATSSVEMTAGPTIHTGLSVSSVDSPHGIAITANGSTIYVVGQGGGDFGGRVLPILTADGATSPMASLDRFGISDPAAVAIDPAGTGLLVADAADNWIVPMPLATFPVASQPVPLPERRAGGSGTGHPTDVVFGPAATGAFVVDGFDTVMPYQPGSRSFGGPIQVCPGASSMAVAPAP